MLLMSCVCHVFASGNCCLVVTCWERTDLLALFVMFNCIFLSFSHVVSPGQVWHWIVSIPDLSRLTCLITFNAYFIVCMFYIPSMLYT